jgi:hypothetical protein
VANPRTSAKAKHAPLSRDLARSGACGRNVGEVRKTEVSDQHCVIVLTSAKE